MARAAETDPALTDIARVERARLPWVVRHRHQVHPAGWVYLVAPGEGVEVRTHNGAIVRIGTERHRATYGALAC